MAVLYEWRGDFNSTEVDELHAQAFETRVFEDSDFNWKSCP